MNDDPQTFRLNLAILLPAYLVFAQLCAFIAALGSLAFYWDFSAPGFLETFLVFSAIATVGALARTFVVAAWHRIEVGPAGIRARPRDRHVTPWASIETVRIVRWTILSYLELEFAKGPGKRFPLYLYDCPGFLAAVERCAGENHPLTWALREWLTHDTE